MARRSPRGGAVDGAASAGRAACGSRPTAAPRSTRTTCWSRPRPTSAWFGRLVPLFVPVYDYVLMTEPLTPARLDSIGWARARGHVGLGQPVPLLPPVGRRPDPVGRVRRGLPPGQPRRRRPTTRGPTTFEKLARQFVETFPQLADIRFTHAWGGAIDTTTRFTVTFGDALGGRVHYALGYTGLGVGSSRWAAGILRDRLLRPDPERVERPQDQAAAALVAVGPVELAADRLDRRATGAARAGTGTAGSGRSAAAAAVRVRAQDEVADDARRPAAGPDAEAGVAEGVGHAARRAPGRTSP